LYYTARQRGLQPRHSPCVALIRFADEPGGPGLSREAAFQGT
jgi:hypothetical protein